MFELADKLVGIYKTHDVTQTITINPNAMLRKISDFTASEEKKAQEVLWYIVAHKKLKIEIE